MRTEQILRRCQEFTAHGGVVDIRAALERAPTSMLLATDAFSTPELFYFGALYARERRGVRR